MTDRRTKDKLLPEVPDRVNDGHGNVFTKGRFLGKGGFARCYELIHPSKRAYAGKIVCKSMLGKPSEKAKLAQEISIHRELNHPHIVRLHEYFEDAANVYILLELCARRSLMELHKRRGAITEPETRFFALQIIDGIDYLHAKMIIHRDLKLGNIFLNDDMQAKIGDFGLATKMSQDDDRKRTLCGTPNYIAPEVLDKAGHGLEVDVWALGCIIYTFLVGNPPFETRSLRETYERIRSNTYRFPTGFNAAGRKLIDDLLRAVPSQRPKISDVKKYAFFLEYTPTSLPVSCLTLAPKYNKPVSDVTKTAKRTRDAPCEPRQLTSRESVVHRADVKPPCEPKDCYAQELYSMIHSAILKAPTREVLVNEDPAECPECIPVFWISKWVDYSDKYGIGYQLSDNSVGVLFNDNSRLILDAAGLNLQYVERDNEEYYQVGKDDLQHIHKKWTLLEYFRNYMNDHLLKAGEKFAPRAGDELARLPCLRSWFRTRSAIVLQLTNGTMQINFFNDVKLILCPRLGAVTIIDRAHNLRSFKLELLAQHGLAGEFRTRLSYAELMAQRLIEKPAAVPAVKQTAERSQSYSSLKKKPQSSQI